jgi:hypothetical protein
MPKYIPAKWKNTQNMLNVNEPGEPPKRRAVTAEAMAAKQRDISVSEFLEPAPAGFR